jgi:hypothetical protein
MFSGSTNAANSSFFRTEKTQHLPNTLTETQICSTRQLKNGKIVIYTRLFHRLNQLNLLAIRILYKRNNLTVPHLIRGVHHRARLPGDRHTRPSQSLANRINVVNLKRDMSITASMRVDVVIPA